MKDYICFGGMLMGTTCVVVALHHSRFNPGLVEVVICHDKSEVFAVKDMAKFRPASCVGYENGGFIVMEFDCQTHTRQKFLPDFPDYEKYLKMFTFEEYRKEWLRTRDELDSATARHVL